MKEFPLTQPAEISTKKKIAAAALGVGAAFLRASNRLFTPRGAHSKRVVLVEPYGMGDAISLLPLVKALLEEQKEVVVCAKPAWRGLFPEEVLWVNAMVPWTSYEDGKKYKISALQSGPMREFFSSLRRLSCGGIGVDPRGDIRSIILLWLAGCREVLSLDHYLGCRLTVPLWAAKRIKYREEDRRWQMNARFLNLITTNDEGGRVLQSQMDRPSLVDQYPLDKLKWNGCKDLLLNDIKEKKPIGIVPVTPWDGRAWPDNCWQKLVSKLLDRGECVVVLCGPGQEGKARAAAGDEASVYVVNSLQDWSVALRMCRAVVTIDSGPMHFADALDVPLVALYNFGRLPLWAPSGPTSLVLHRLKDPDYAPAHQTDNEIERGKLLMARHTVDDVFVALLQCL